VRHARGCGITQPPPQKSKEHDDGHLVAGCHYEAAVLRAAVDQAIVRVPTHTAQQQRNRAGAGGRTFPCAGMAAARSARRVRCVERLCISNRVSRVLPLRNRCAGHEGGAAGRWLH
jgi:hypothetical protein